MMDLNEAISRSMESSIEIMRKMAINALYEATLKSGCGMDFFKLAKDGINKRFDNFSAITGVMAELRKPEILLFSERRKLADSFTNWAEQNGVAQTPESVIAYLFIEDLLDVPKCRLLISDGEEET